MLANSERLLQSRLAGAGGVVKDLGLLTNVHTSMASFACKAVLFHDSMPSVRHALSASDRIAGHPGIPSVNT